MASAWTTESVGAAPRIADPPFDIDVETLRWLGGATTRGDPERQRLSELHIRSYSTR